MSTKNKWVKKVGKFFLVSYLSLSIAFGGFAPSLIAYAEENSTENPVVTDATVVDSTEATVIPETSSGEDDAIPTTESVEEVVEQIVEPTETSTVDTSETSLVAEEEVNPIDNTSSASLSDVVPTETTTTTTPVLSTDKEDYHPGETATIFGNLFGSFQNIVLKIFGSDLGGENYTEETQNITTDASGSFTTIYVLDNIFRPYYDMVVSSPNGAVLATSYFLDSGIAKYDQCSNDDGDGYADGCHWINGNLQPNNSTYTEGDATVQRVLIGGLAPNSSHSILIKYGTTKGGKHAYDFLTTDTFSEDYVNRNELCKGLNGFPSCATTGITDTSEQISEDPENYENTDALTSDRYFSIINGEFISVGTPTLLPSGDYTGDSETTILVNFTVPSNCVDKDNKGNCSTLISWGAHISKSTEWNGEPTAVNITGSPYHVAIDQLDDAAVGQRDNQMQANTIAQTGSITIVKDAVPNDAQDFSFTTTGTGLSAFTLDDDSNNTLLNSQTFSALTAGTYTVDEGVVAGWTLTNLACTDPTNNSNVNLSTGVATINLAAGESVTCTYTNTLQTGHLVVDKVTIPAGDATQFSINASGNGTITGGGAGTVTDATNKDYEVTAGTYSVTETIPAGWVETSNTCSSVSVAAGETKTCVITNTKLGTVVINKIATGGNATFSYTGTGSNISANFDITTSAGTGSQTFNNVTPGTKTVIETSPVSPWAFTNLTCSDPDSGSNVDINTRTATIDVDAGETITCTYSNTKQPTLTVNKVVAPANDTGRFNLRIDGVTTGTGAEVGNGGTTGAQIVSIGAHNVSETADIATTLSDYTAVISGDCASDGSVSLAAGDNKICTITNTKKGTIVIEKQTLPNGSLQSFAFTGEIATSLNDGQISSKKVVPGQYTVTESSIGGWDLTTLSCSDSNSTGNIGTRTATFNVEAGEIVTCTFTNTQRGSVSGHKYHDVNGNGSISGDPTLPGWTIKLYDTVTNPWTLIDTQVTNGTGSYSFTNLLPGNYKVCEVLQTGWIKTFDTVNTTSNPNNTNELCQTTTINPGTNATRNFGNFELGSITIVKNTIGGNDTFNYTTTGGTPLVNFSTVTVANTGNEVVNDVGPGVYTITEDTLAGWVLTGLSCATGGVADLGNKKATVTITSGVDVTCTFTNNKPAAQIDVTPLTATNKVGDNHVIAATVLTHNGNGAWASTIDNTLVTFSITNSNGATATFVGGDTCTTTAGTCSITINSSTAGHVVVKASATPVVLGVSLPVSTGTGGENSADAQKDYVNARISITPNTAVNEVGHAHTFTVTVEKKTGLTWEAVEGAIVDGGVTPAPTAFDESDCTAGTDSSGQCTIILNSTTVGTFTVTAGTTINVGGVVFNLLTDGTSSNSAAAVKNYVDGYITITPEAATNNIKDAHTFTVKVTQVPGSATPVATSADVSALVTPAPGSLITTCDNDVPFTGNIATCTITINNNTPGVFTASATSTFAIGGVLLTRGTDATGLNSGSGTKTYVAGALKITKVVPDLTGILNYTSINKTFTVNVKGPSYPGAGHDINFTVLNGVLQTPTSVTLDPIIPGAYTITEVDAGAEWTEVVTGGAPATVVASQPATEVTVTNTYTPGSLELKKIVGLNGYIFPNTVDLDFTINVTGPSYPAPHAVVINVANGLPTNSPQILSNLIPGEYTVTEVDPGIAWSVSGNGNVTVSSGNQASKTITNNLLIPKTTINMTADTWETTPGGNVTLTITDTNDGQVPISNPSVALFGNNVLTNPQPTYVSGDANSNSIMDIGETWTWTVTLVISANTTFTVNGIGTDPLGNLVNGGVGAGFYPSETFTKEVKVIGTTRTLGFWQTHTNFTTMVYNSFINSTSSNPLFIGVNVWPTAGTHKGKITATSTPGASQLFGGFYAPIAKKTDGSKRTPVDQARIQMLQQLLAAKLNCAAFGCSGATQTLIANADAAYSAVTPNKNTIISLAGQLDAFNNSGDANAIPPSLGVTGKATPSTSKLIANMAFWDLP